MYDEKKHSLSLDEITVKMIESYQSDNEMFLKEAKDFVERKFFDELEIIQSLLFPKYFNNATIAEDIDELRDELQQTIGIFAKVLDAYIDNSEEIAKNLVSKFPDIREMLKKDVEAAYKGDPAAHSYTEIIRAYPGFKAIMMHRVSHELYKMGVPSYPRELSEMTHQITGADIHPGAKIGEYFFMDHATGIVIGETSEIGDWVRMYQGVTLGALHFMKKENGELAKNYKRHPTIKNHVVIGMGAKIVGPITIGNYVNIGANVWLQEDVKDGMTVYIKEHPAVVKKPNGHSKKK